MTAVEDRIPKSLFAAMVFQFGVGGAVLPFISIYFRDRGLAVHEITHIFFASSASLLVFPFLWGYLSDRFIPINRLFTLLNATALIMLFVLLRPMSYLGYLIAFTLFYAFFHPTFTLINAMSFHHLSDPGEQFGWLRAWGSLGWIIPSLPIYLWLTFHSDQSLTIALGLAIAFCLVMIVTTFYLPHTEPGAMPNPVGLKPALTYWQAIKKLFSNLTFLTVLASFFLMSGSFSILIYYSPPLLVEQGVPKAWIGPIQSFGVLPEILIFPYLKLVIRKWGYAAPILFGSACLVIRHAIYAYSESVPLLIGSYVLAGFVVIFYIITNSILVNALATKEVRATAQTLLVLFGSGMGPMFANFLAGVLADHTGGSLRMIFGLGTVLATLALLLLAMRSRQLVHPEFETIR